MNQRCNVVPLPGPHGERDENDEYLLAFGFEKPRFEVDKSVYLSALLISALLFWLGYSLFIGGTEIKTTDVAVATATLGTLLVGFRQWRNARHEISIDKYYERLEVANHRQDDNHTSVHEMMRSSTPEISGETPEVLFYIYAELDNLEYVIEKYRFGFMNCSQACRGLRTFQLRCWSEHFRRIVRHRVHAGDYNARTRNVVKKVYDTIEDMIARDYRSGSATDRRRTPPGPASPHRRAADYPRAAPALSGSPDSERTSQPG